MICVYIVGLRFRYHYTPSVVLQLLTSSNVKHVIQMM